MNFTGYVRQIDPVGRLVLPMDLRVRLDLQSKSFVEFFLDGDSIVLKKYNPACVFCGKSNALVTYNEKSVCKECISKLNLASGEGVE